MSVMLQPPPASQGHSALWLFAEEVLLKQTKGVWSRFTRCTPFILELCTFPAWVLQFWGHLGAGRIPSEAGAGEGCWRGRKDPGRGNCAWITKKKGRTHTGGRGRAALPQHPRARRFLSQRIIWVWICQQRNQAGNFHYLMEKKYQDLNGKQKANPEKHPIHKLMEFMEVFKATHRYLMMELL